MAAPVTEFYDSLSPEYHDNMGWDWEPTMRKEGATLARFTKHRHVMGTILRPVL